jgi:hypothetical protein
MYHPIALEFIARERTEQLHHLAQTCRVHREAPAGARGRIAALLVRVGMLLDHAAAERAAAHVHAV